MICGDISPQRRRELGVNEEKPHFLPMTVKSGAGFKLEFTGAEISTKALMNGPRRKQQIRNERL
jgi:hypothetical protein